MTTSSNESGEDFVITHSMRKGMGLVQAQEVLASVIQDVSLEFAQSF